MTSGAQGMPAKPWADQASKAWNPRRAWSRRRGLEVSLMSTCKLLGVR